MYRRWSTKEHLVADAIEAHVGTDLRWPTPDEIDDISPHDLVLRNLPATAVSIFSSIKLSAMA